MPVLIIIAVLALIAEFAAIVRCVIYGIPLGHNFGCAIVAQFALPFLTFALFALWGFISPPVRGLEPLTGEIWDRSSAFIGAVFWGELLAILTAGSLGVRRSFIPLPVDNKASKPNHQL